MILLCREKTLKIYAYISMSDSNHAPRPIRERLLFHLCLLIFAFLSAHSDKNQLEKLKKKKRNSTRRTAGKKGIRHQMNDSLLSMEVDSHIKQRQGQRHLPMIDHHSLLLNRNIHNTTL